MAKLPERYTAFLKEYPDVGDAYHSLSKAAAAAGPLDKKTAMLVKLGIAIAADLEGGTHSAARKALEAGCTPDEVRHAAILAVTTLGFPSMMKGLSWIDDVIEASR